jgi:hypothetical protein
MRTIIRFLLIDIGFVDDVFIKSNILPEREENSMLYNLFIDQMSIKVVRRPPEEVHIEEERHVMERLYICRYL